MLKFNNVCKKYPHMIQLLEKEVYERRRERGISQYVLAEKVGVTRNCIYQMECHAHIPKAETVFEIIMALGFSEEERKAFAEKYMEAYCKDKAVQKERDKKLVGIV